MTVQSEIEFQIRENVRLTSEDQDQLFIKRGVPMFDELWEDCDGGGGSLVVIFKRGSLFIPGREYRKEKVIKAINDAGGSIVAAATVDVVYSIGGDGTTIQVRATWLEIEKFRRCLLAPAISPGELLSERENKFFLRLPAVRA